MYRIQASVVEYKAKIETSLTIRLAPNVTVNPISFL